MKHEEIIEFWFHELQEKQWWVKDPELDLQIKQRFTDVYNAAARGECYSWRDSPDGRLAEIICLDQFPRNIFRGQPQAFATDGLALVLAQEAVRVGADQALNGPKRSFIYMPFMHSESRLIQEESIRLFSHPEVEKNRRFAIDHKAIIDRFGRYPHRNAILCRETTEEEALFLQGPKSSF